MAGRRFGKSTKFPWPMRRCHRDGEDREPEITIPPDSHSPAGFRYVASRLDELTRVGRGSSTRPRVARRNGKRLSDVEHASHLPDVYRPALGERESGILSRYHGGRSGSRSTCSISRIYPCHIGAVTSLASSRPTHPTGQPTICATATNVSTQSSFRRLLVPSLSSGALVSTSRRYRQRSVNCSTKRLHSASVTGSLSRFTMAAARLLPSPSRRAHGARHLSAASRTTERVLLRGVGAGEITVQSVRSSNCVRIMPISA